MRTVPLERRVMHQDYIKEKAVETLADALPKEMARVREVLGHYKEIGPAGMFGAAFIEQDLRAADAAQQNPDRAF